MLSPPPCSTLFPYTTLFRSLADVLAARGARRCPGPRVERDALDGGWLVLPDGERSVPAGRPRFPPPRDRLVHERGAGPRRYVRHGARDPGHGGDDCVRGPAVVAPVGGLGGEVSAGRNRRRREHRVVVDAGLPPPGAVAPTCEAVPTARLPHGEIGRAHV